MKKFLPWILGALAIGGLAYWFKRRRRLPSNFNSLTPAQQRAYLAALDRASNVDSSQYE